MPTFKIKDLMVHVLGSGAKAADLTTDCTFGCTEGECTRVSWCECTAAGCTCSYCSDGCTHCTCCSNSQCASSGETGLLQRSRRDPAQSMDRLGLAELAALREQLEAARKAVDERHALLESSLAPRTHDQLDDLEAKLRVSLQELDRIRENLGPRPDKK